MLLELPFEYVPINIHYDILLLVQIQFFNRLGKCQTQEAFVSNVLHANQLIYMQKATSIYKLELAVFFYQDNLSLITKTNQKFLNIIGALCNMRPKQDACWKSKAFTYTLRDLKVDHQNIFESLKTNASNYSGRKRHQRHDKKLSNSTIDKAVGQLPIYQPSHSRPGVTFNNYDSFCNQEETQNIQLLNVLTQIENQYIESGNFLQAEQIRVRKQAIRRQLRNQKKQQAIRKTIRSKDEQIRRMVQQFQKDVESWEQQLGNLVENVKQTEKQLVFQQRLQLQELQRQFQEKFQGQLQQMKFSSSVLNLEAKLERSIKLQSYIEAQKLKVQLQHKAVKEKEAHRMILLQKIERKRKTLLNKHKKQIGNFRFKYGNILQQKIVRRNQQLDKKNKLIQRKNAQGARSRQKIQQISFSRANTNRKVQIKSQRNP